MENPKFKFSSHFEVLKRRVADLPIIECLSTKSATLQGRWGKLQPQERGYYKNMALWGVLTATDIVTTHMFLSQGYPEIHPVGARILENFGELGLYAFRITGALIVAALNEIVRRKSGYSIPNIAYRIENGMAAFVSVWNLSTFIPL